MSTSVTPHLNFDGNARQALEFYHSVFGGSITISTYGEAGAGHAVLYPDKVMWGQVICDSGFRVMAYDVQADRAWNQGENSFYMVLENSQAEEIKAYWEGLSVGATLLHAIGPSAWSPLYGMLKDSFGVTWVISLTPERRLAEPK